MTIDERLDRLTGPHEALTMNLESVSCELQDLKAAMQIDAKTFGRWPALPNYAMSG